ncbi:hypothetical protein DFJ73DRAFT_813973 [Zopfochytrium polystomum]|nr:hypothetical protein DFJ73DRAFT_813973 [Zopfochytrium polystomum]
MLPRTLLPARLHLTFSLPISLYLHNCVSVCVCVSLCVRVCVLLLVPPKTFFVHQQQQVGALDTTKRKSKMSKLLIQYVHYL